MDTNTIVTRAFSVVANKDGQHFGNVSLNIPASLTTKEQLRDFLLTDAGVLTALKGVMGESAPHRTPDRTHGWVYATTGNVKGTDSELRVTPAALGGTPSRNTTPAAPAAPAGPPTWDAMLASVLAVVPDGPARDAVRAAMTAQRDAARQALTQLEADNAITLDKLAATQGEYQQALDKLAAAQESVKGWEQELAARVADARPVVDARKAFAAQWGLDS